MDERMTQLGIMQTFLDIHREKGPEAAIAWAAQEEAKLEEAAVQRRRDAMHLVDSA